MASQNVSYWRTETNIKQVYDKSLKNITDLNQYPVLYADHPACDDHCRNRTELLLLVTPNPVLPALLEHYPLHFHLRNLTKKIKNNLKKTLQLALFKEEIYSH